MGKAKGAGNIQEQEKQPGLIQRTFPPLQNASISFFKLKIIKQGNKIISCTISLLHMNYYYSSPVTSHDFALLVLIHNDFVKSDSQK